MKTIRDIIGPGQAARLEQFEDDFNCVVGQRITGKWFILTNAGEFIEFDSFAALRAEIERQGEDW